MGGSAFTAEPWEGLLAPESSSSPTARGCILEGPREEGGAQREEQDPPHNRCPQRKMKMQGPHSKNRRTVPLKVQKPFPFSPRSLSGCHGTFPLLLKVLLSKEKLTL